MSVVKKDYLICYDIATVEVDDIKGTKRLSQVAKYLEKNAFRIQYSIFLLQKSTRKEIDKIIVELKELISIDEDDIRIYTIKNSGFKSGIAVDLDEPFIIR
ncbi:MAG: CRISPR-associated endonuclease Cas2 [Campylobacterota bacterium]|nr:CRISPR-associated endonuclease Cas2 [Campylobacterota bacterium]